LTANAIGDFDANPDPTRNRRTMSAGSLECWLPERAASELRHAQTVIASEAKQCTLKDCGRRLAWIASLSLAMTTDAIRPQCNML
jgi:hypothetical protein